MTDLTSAHPALDALRPPETMRADRWVLLDGGKEIGMAAEGEGSVLYDQHLVHADAVHIARWDPATATTVLDALESALAMLAEAGVPTGVKLLGDLLDTLTVEAEVADRPTAAEVRAEGRRLWAEYQDPEEADDE